MAVGGKIHVSVQSLSLHIWHFPFLCTCTHLCLSPFLLPSLLCNFSSPSLFPCHWSNGLSQGSFGQHQSEAWLLSVSPTLSSIERFHLKFVRQWQSEETLIPTFPSLSLAIHRCTFLCHCTHQCLSPLLLPPVLCNFFSMSLFPCNWSYGSS